MNKQSSPQAGPPKKGFWGFLAGMFPKRPDPLEPSEPTEEAPLQKRVSQLNPSDPEAGQQKPADSSVTNAPHIPPEADPDSEADPNRSGKPLQGSRSITEAQVPQTEEKGAPNTEGEDAPPTLATPQSIKAPTLEENDNFPPTLPTQPPASGGSGVDSSTPEPGDPYDPKEYR